jgi:carbamoyltransferase
MPDHQGELWGIEALNVPRSDIPAVTHLDYSARIQTVSAERDPMYHALISEFDRLTGCPLLVNTSFNVRGEPIVLTPTDAYTCFMRTHLDYLAIGSFLLDKKQQPSFDVESWQASIPLD